MVRIDRPAPVTLDKPHQDLKKATQQFESYFLDELFKEMRKTVPENKLLADDGHGKDIFQGMMDQKLSENMAERGDLGLAKMMYDQLAPTLTKTVPPTAAGDPAAAVKPISLTAKAIMLTDPKGIAVTKTREGIKFTR